MRGTSKITDGCQNIEQPVPSKRKSSKKDPNVNKQIATYCKVSRYRHVVRNDKKLLTNLKNTSY